MASVGVRELKNRLSHYLEMVEQGTWVQVTRRGKVVALLVPAKQPVPLDALMDLLEAGLASWRGGKPQGAPRPVEGRGRPLSDIVAEDRR